MTIMMMMMEIMVWAMAAGNNGTILVALTVDWQLLGIITTFLKLTR